MSDVDSSTTVAGFLPWQHTLRDSLLDRHRHGRLPHAWLLHGSEGIGKQQFARAFAAWRLCQGDNTAEMACGICKSCQLLRAGSHPDLMLVEPETAGGQLKISQVREISEFVNQTASRPGAARIVLLQPAEALGQSAANALLKSLEEPPGDSLFLLISHVPGGILPTIRSRCQPVAMPIPDADQARQWLEHHAGDADQVEQAHRLAPRQPLRAMQLLEAGVPALYAFLEQATVQYLQRRDDLAALIKGCQDADERQILGFLQNDMAVRIRQYMLNTPGGGLDGERLSAMFGLQRELLDIERQLAGTANPNRQLTLETMFLRWKQVILPCQ